MIGEKLIDRYLITQELGRGGMAVVYRAEDLTLKREVAIKMLHPHLASNPASARRFLVESQAIAKLHHPNIIEIYDAVQDPKTKANFLVMELIDGVTLRSFIETHPIKVPEIGVAIISQICDALSHAHAQGVIHRDIKPENIMIANHRVAKLMDFGIARILDEERVTASGSLLGSPAHMPPEIIEGESYTETCDIFSLGTVLYYVTTSALPFQGTTPMAVFKSILDANYQEPRLRNAAISKELSQTIARSLQTDPQNRYQSTEELKKDLTLILQNANITKPDTLLAQYFASPDIQEASLIATLISHFNQRSRAALGNKQIPGAIDFINRSLHYDAGNQEALEILHRIQRKKRTRNLILWFCAALVLILIAATAAILYLNAPPPTIAAASHTSPQDSSQTTILTDPVQNTLPPESTANTLHASNSQDLFGVLPKKAPLYHDAPYYFRFEHDPVTPKPQAPPNDPKPTPTKTGPPKPNPKTTPKIQTPTHTDTPNTNPDPPPLLAPSTTPTRVSVTQPVFPPESYAIVNATRYEANSSGDITLQLLPGQYQMLLNCPLRCEQRSQRIQIDANQDTQTLPLITLNWANATLQIIPPASRDCYFVARRLNERSNDITYLVARTPNAIRGFNAFGKEIQLEVYAIPKTSAIRNYDLAELERVKYLSTRVSLSPGESKTLNFD